MAELGPIQAQTDQRCCLNSRCSELRLHVCSMPSTKPGPIKATGAQMIMPYFWEPESVLPGHTASNVTVTVCAAEDLDVAE